MMSFTELPAPHPTPGAGTRFVDCLAPSTVVTVHAPSASPTHPTPAHLQSLPVDGLPCSAVAVREVTALKIGRSRRMRDDGWERHILQHSRHVGGNCRRGSGGSGMEPAASREDPGDLVGKQVVHQDGSDR